MEARDLAQGGRERESVISLSRDRERAPRCSKPLVRITHVPEGPRQILKGAEYRARDRALVVSQPLFEHYNLFQIFASCLQVSQPERRHRKIKEPPRQPGRTVGIAGKSKHFLSQLHTFTEMRAEHVVLR